MSARMHESDIYDLQKVFYGSIGTKTAIAVPENFKFILERILISFDADVNVSISDGTNVRNFATLGFETEDFRFLGLAAWDLGKDITVTISSTPFAFAETTIWYRLSR